MTGKNVGKTERTIRIILGIVLIVISPLFTGLLAWSSGLIGIYAVITGFLSH